LITWLLLAEREVSLKRFYVRRALRLFPAFYGYWLAMVGLLLITHKSVPWGSALSAFFYVVNYYNATHGHPASFISHAWSLAVEEQFYLLWPIVFVLVGANRTRLAWLLAGVIASAWVHRAACTLAGVPDAWLYNAFDCRVDHLLVGCLGAVLLKLRALPALFDLLARSRALAASIAGLLLTIGWFELELGRPFLYIVAHAIEPPLVMALVVFIVANAARAPVRWLQSKALAHVGKVSYGIYLFHPVLLEPVRSHTAFLPEALRTLVIVLVTIGVASASFALYERRFLALKDRFRS
jgi:peptidoglycan/LPS O-acetylase OafA/YrhL